MVFCFFVGESCVNGWMLVFLDMELGMKDTVVERKERELKIAGRPRCDFQKGTANELTDT
jgi:hypothetical protein